MKKRIQILTPGEHALPEGTKLTQYNNGGYCEYFDQEIITSSGNECPIDGEEINSEYKESDK